MTTSETIDDQVQIGEQAISPSRQALNDTMQALSKVMMQQMQLSAGQVDIGSLILTSKVMARHLELMTEIVARMSAGTQVALTEDDIRDMLNERMQTDLNQMRDIMMSQRLLVPQGARMNPTNGPSRRR